MQHFITINVSTSLWWIAITAIVLVTICYTVFKVSSKIGIRLCIAGAAWLVIQGFLAKMGFYQNYSLPPRLVIIGVLPALTVVLFVLFSKRTSPVVGKLSIVLLTSIHSVRIPVELGLHNLYTQGLVAHEMTYLGYNLDIISGITAPIVAWLFYKNYISKKVLLWWNIACLTLVLNIVAIAVLATPYPFQQISLDQPNLAVFYFPVIYLPTIIVPIVLFSHIASLKQLLKK